MGELKPGPPAQRWPEPPHSRADQSWGRTCLLKANGFLEESPKNSLSWIIGLSWNFQMQANILIAERGSVTLQQQQEVSWFFIDEAVILFVDYNRANQI